MHAMIEATFRLISSAHILEDNRVFVLDKEIDEVAGVSVLVVAGAHKNYRQPSTAGLAVPHRIENVGGKLGAISHRNGHIPLHSRRLGRSHGGAPGRTGVRGAHHARHSAELP